MRFSTYLLALALVIAAALAAGCTGPAAPPANQSGAVPTATAAPAAAKNASPEELVAFVERAYEFAHVHGQEAALREFNNPTGRFVDGELYIFAYDLNGTTLALPFQPDLLGTSRWNTTDASGTPYIREIVGAAKIGGGFVRYLYPDPADNFTIKQKLSYAMMVDPGWLIGAGIYNSGEGSPIVEVGGDPRVREDLASLVGEAIAYAEEHGRDAALAEFNDRNGTFVRGNLYVYAFDYDGTTLALPFQPRLIGTDLSGLQDPYGVNYTRVEILLSQHGGGFVFYHYPDPARNMTPEPKMSYVRGVDETWWLGAGIYLEDANRPGPSPMAAPRGMTPADLAAFVQNASAYVTEMGAHAALAEFQQKDGQFSRGELYVYVYGRNGTLLAHPYQAELVGTDRTNWTDVRGLSFVRVGNETAANGGGFIAYLYPAPRNGTIDEKAPDAYEPKIGYVAPAGEEMWIGSGVYLRDLAYNGTGPDPVSEMVGLVERCAAYGRAEGARNAFSEISNRSGSFVDGDGHYIYAYDYNGTLLAHPHLPDKVGTSLMERRDTFGMENIRALAATARSGGGYIVFVWPNPDNGNRDELKIGYVLPVDDNWWVGSGVYLSEITGTDASLAPAP